MSQLTGLPRPGDQPRPGLASEALSTQPGAGEADQARPPAPRPAAPRPSVPRSSAPRPTRASRARARLGRPDGGSWPDGMPRPEVDAARWPDVADVPRGPVRAGIARLLLATVAARLKIAVRFPDGRLLADAGPGTPTMYLWRPADFFRRVGAGGLIGFGESYMAGDWDSDDLAGLLTIMAGQMDRLVPRWLQWLRAVYVSRPPADWDADPEGARRNVHQHYDLSNDMFALFLDETMTYSAALFEREPFRAGPVPAGAPEGAPAVLAPVPAPGAEAGGPTDTLAAAQRRKIDRILDLAAVGPGSRVLEIGTGWGELAIRAAGRGAQVLSITVSAEQQALAQQRIAAAGLADRVTVELRDYREVTGQFDAIVSVEMIEAVAERYWPAYFAALDRLLAPGGRIGLQSIIMAHHRMLATRRTQTWILKYIFPGGLIPSVTAIEDNLREHTTLEITGRHDFGPHYARTLQIWRDRFGAAAEDLDDLGFDAVFRRMWELYLAYSEAGFRSGYLEVSQFQLARAVTAADPAAAGLEAGADPGPGGSRDRGGSPDAPGTGVAA
jgi:cyclopropane-fatty-acyl-phospholipid synthase